MLKYKVPINLHKFSDCSDTPKRGYRNITAESEADMEKQLYAFRKAADDGVDIGKQRYYVGLVFPEAAIAYYPQNQSQWRETQDPEAARYGRE